MIKYGIDMVICNLFHARHVVVSALASETNNNTRHKRNKETMYDMNLKKSESEQQLIIQMI